MSLHKHLDRTRRIHQLIKFRRTGTPRSFADKLGISLSLLYRLLGELKDMGAPIHYCHIRQSYAYYEHVELKLGFFPRELKGNALRAVSGGAKILSLSGRGHYSDLFTLQL